MNKMRLSKVKIYNMLWVVCLMSAVGFGTIMGISAYQIANDRARLLQDVTKLDSTILRPDGVTVGYSVFMNKSLDKSQSFPVVILQHGVGGRRENFEPMALAFIARGFIVVTTTLRNHIGSTGHTTLGNAEADDILAILETVKSILVAQQILIKDIGVVGHSLGSLVATLVALRGHLNSCVAIAPPGNFSRLISNFVGVGFAELDSVFSGFNNYSDPAYMTNISIITQDRPRNYLMIGGFEDGSVLEPDVRALFYKHMNSSQATDFTRYGSFQAGTAIELDFYHVQDHGSEQYPFMTPEITIAAINWTEQALGLTNGTGLIEIPSAINNYQPIFDAWGQISGIYFVIFVFSVFFCGVFLFAALASSKSSPNPPSSPEVAPDKDYSLKAAFIQLLKDTEFRILLGVTALVGSIFSLLVRSTSQFLFIQIPLSILTPLFIGLCVGMLFIGFRRYRSGSFPILSFQFSSNLLPLLGTIYGVFIAFCFTIYPIQLCLITGNELWIKPFPVIPGIWREFFWFVLCCVGSELILSSFLQRNSLRNANKKWLLLLGIPMILFVLSLLFGICNANRSFTLTVFGLTLWIPAVFALVIGLMGFGFEFLNLFYRNHTKTTILGPLVLSWIAGWILLTSVLGF